MCTQNPTLVIMTTKQSSKHTDDTLVVTLTGHRDTSIVKVTTNQSSNPFDEGLVVSYLTTDHSSCLLTSN